MLNFGVIGPGGIAKKFAKAVELVEDVQIVAVASRNIKRAQEYAQEFSIAKAYEGYENLLKDDNVQAVYIALPHNFHVDIIKKCADYNKAILCEKPLTVSEELAKQSIEYVKDKNVLMMEAMWTRFLPCTLKAKEWIAQGKIGDVKLIRTDMSRFVNVEKEHRLLNKDLAGGCLLDIGIYSVEFAMDIAQSKAKIINAITEIGETDVDVMSIYSIKMDNGVYFSGNCSFNAASSMDGIISGPKGYIKMPQYWACKKCKLYSVDDKLIEEFDGTFDNGFEYQINHFSELYKTNKKESSIVPFETTIEAARVIDELLKQTY